jgi:polyisoprenoid-binding protein YceI
VLALIKTIIQISKHKLANYKRSKSMSWKIDPSHSLIEFSVKHMMITKVRGQFTSFDGAVTVDPTSLPASKVEGSIDVASIDTGEEQRDNHLRSADFFDVENYPQMTFRSTRIEAMGGDEYKVYGDMTIKDVRREVVFEVSNEGQGQDPWGGQRWGISATARLNRKDFGLTWNVALETGGWLVGDEVKITIELQLVQEQPQPETVAAA